VYGYLSLEALFRQYPEPASRIIAVIAAEARPASAAVS
jgi:hypothetical protein